MSTVARPAHPATGTPIDVHRVLEAQYLAAVVQELEARRVAVDAAVLNGAGRPGGTVVLADPAPDRPSCARWNGGRSWTLISVAGAHGGVRRRRLRRRRRLLTPDEVARCVAAVGRRRSPALPWRPVSGWHPARGH